MQRRNKYKKGQYGHILEEIQEKTTDVETSNAFGVLNEEEVKDH